VVIYNATKLSQRCGCLRNNGQTETTETGHQRRPYGLLQTWFTTCTYIPICVENDKTLDIDEDSLKQFTCVC